LSNAPKLRPEHNDCWNVYTSLSDYTYNEIHRYIELTGNRLDAWEVEAIMGLAKYRNAEPTWPLK